MTVVDQRLERVVRAEMRRLGRGPERSKTRSHWPAPVAPRVRHGRGVLTYNDRAAVPVLRRPITWLEQARGALVDLLAGERGLADRSQTPAITDLPESPR